MNLPTNLPSLLALRASAAPDRIALRCEEEVLSYAALHAAAGRLAAGLADIGVRPGDPVCVLLETSCDHAVTWLALNWIGAIEVPINTGFRGDALADALALTGAALLIVDAGYLDLLPAARSGMADIRSLVVRGDPDPAGAPEDCPVTRFDTLASFDGRVPPIVSNAPGDTAMLLFTSGSTGRSKGCEIPHHYVLRQPEIFCHELGIGPDDVLYAPFPLFHADGAIFTLAAAISAGATAALAPRFSVSGFWDDCRRHGATVIDYMGATLALLFRQPASPRDRDHQVRLGWGVPAPPFADAFEARFGFELVEIYGLSDAGIPVYNRPGEVRRPGSCGRAVAPFQVQIHGPDGRELPDGEIGEIVIRGDEPYLVTTGYFGDPAAAEAAFRDGWLRTGDLARRDADGFFHFVGRTRDIIRRRGENISAFDLERVLLSHPDVAEAAAYGVPSELTEDDIMVTVVPRDGATLDPRALREWAVGRLARHMVPRYVRVAASVPRTPTEKVAKHILVAEGVTADAVDFDPPRPPSRESRHD